MSKCEHDKRFSGVFLMPKGDHGCVACAYERVAAENKKIRDVADEQAKDEGLWFEAQTAPESYLQQELRRLHKVIEE